MGSNVAIRFLYCIVPEGLCLTILYHCLIGGFIVKVSYSHICGLAAACKCRSLNTLCVKRPNPGIAHVKPNTIRESNTSVRTRYRGKAAVATEDLQIGPAIDSLGKPPVIFSRCHKAVCRLHFCFLANAEEAGPTFSGDGAHSGRPA